MPLFPNPWGPAYSGVRGRLRKMGEIAVQPGNYPFMVVGSLCAFFTLASIPVSKYRNRDAIMEEKKARTGSYH